MIQSSPVYIFDNDIPGKIKNFKGKKLFSQTHELEYETSTPKK